MNKRSISLIVLATVAILISVAAPVLSTGDLSGNQQYASCGCHGTQSSVTVTMQSSPGTAQTLSPGQTVSIWINVTGAIGGTSLGALIASSQASSNSLPTQNGWTILSDPSGTSTTYNYYKVQTYTGSRSFAWTLTAPSTVGMYPLYARVLHTGAEEFTKSAGPLNFDVQQAVIGPPQVQITRPADGAVVSGTIFVNVTATPGSGQTIGYVNLRVDGAEVNNDTVFPYAFTVLTSDYVNGPHVLNATGADTAGRRGYSQITVTVNNAPPANPTVVITSPTNGQVVIGSISVAATVRQGSGQTIAYVSMMIDGAQFDNDTTAPYSAILDTTAYPDGQHLLNVTGADTVGRKGYQQITILINNTGSVVPVPIVDIASPTNGATVAGVIVVAATVTSEVQIEHVNLTFGGVPQGARLAAPFNWNVDTNDVANGQQNVNVTAIDVNGRSGYMQILVVVDNTAPTVSITSPGADSTASGNITVDLSITNSSAISYVLVSVDGVVAINETSPPYTSVIDTYSSSDGLHTINATVVDEHGRKGYTQISVNFLNAPSITITSPVAGANYAGVIVVSASVSGRAPMAFVELRVSGSLFSNSTKEPYSWELNTAEFGDGLLFLNVTARDTFGRIAYQEITVVIDNLGQDEPLDRFFGTIIAGSLGLIALITALVVAVLFMRGKRSGGI